MRKIIEELDALDKTIKNKIKPNNEESCLNNINLTQLKIIIYLIDHKDEEVCQKDFEDFLKIKKASITGALESMEDKDLIVRIKSEDDARKKIVRLSPALEEKRLKGINILNEMEEIIANDVSEEHLNIFFDTIKKMRENIETLLH